MPEDTELPVDSQNTEGEDGEPKPEKPQEEFSDRERQLYARAHRAEDRLKEVEQKITDLESTRQERKLTSDEEKELAAQKYLENLIEKSLEKKTQVQQQAEVKEQQDFERNVDSALSVHTEVKRDDFLKFIEEKGDHYGIQSVEGAMRVYLDLKTQTSEAERQKAREKAPGVPSSEGASKPPPPDDKGKTLSQIADEVIRGMK